MFRAIFILTILTISSASYASSLPAEIKKSIETAIATSDNFIVNSVVKSAKKRFPSAISEIDSMTLATRQENLEQKLSTLSPSAGADKSKNFSGSVEFGTSYKTGNTEEQQMNILSELRYFWNKFENILNLKANNNKENDVRTSEEYRIKNQLKYTLSEKDYAFGELEYVNDRFSGYNFRTSELIGYGRNVLTRDNMNLSLEASAGARQSGLENGDNENSIMGKLGGNFDWQIRENIAFKEELDISFAQDATITESSTSIKSTLTDKLYLKLSFDVEHISDVPAGRENTDTITAITVGYGF